MGSLARIDLAALVEAHAIDALVETGTGHGESVAAALEVPTLIEIVSIEIDHETWVRNTIRFENAARVRVFFGDSPQVIPGIAAEATALKRRVLWFFDAHFPGSGRHKNPLPMMTPHGVAAAVPIVQEISALFAHRNVAHDVVVIDDLCMFEPGDYESDSPAMRAELRLGSLSWIDDWFRATHTVSRLMLDGGYLIARPKA